MWPVCAPKNADQMAGGVEMLVKPLYGKVHTHLYFLQLKS